MRCGLLWLTLVDLKRAWLRSSLAALAIAMALVAVTFFAGQVGLRQAELLTGYEESGAATFIVELSKVPTSSIADLVRALQKREAAGITGRTDHRAWGRSIIRSGSRLLCEFP